MNNNRSMQLSRLAVLALLVLVPIATFLIFYTSGFVVPWFPEGLFKNILLLYVLPIMFAASWVFFIALFAERMADSLDSMTENQSVIPNRLRYFFGLNAASVLILFGFPILTPIVAILSLASLMFRTLTRRKEWDEDEKVGTFTKVLVVLACIPGVLGAVMILPEMLDFSVFVWNEVWFPFTPLLYLVSISMATAFTFGSFISLLLGWGDRSERSVEQRLGTRMFEGFLFAAVFVMGYYRTPVFDVLLNFGLVLVIVLWLAQWLRGRQATVDFKSYFFGYLMTALFLGTSFLFGSEDLSLAQIEMWRSILLVATGALHIIIFIIIFIRLEDHDE